MKVRFRSWRQKIQQRPLRLVVIIGAGLLGIVLLVAAIAGYFFNWDWTGFGSYIPPTKDNNFQRAKTLWDWMQLLLVPILLAIGGFWLNQIQKNREERSAQQRAKNEERSAQQRAKVEREIAEYNQGAAVLQEYIDKMSELLLEKKLRKSAKDDEIRKIARARTLTVLPRLNSVQKRSILQFLYESSLLDKDKCIVDLAEADLSRAYLSSINLSKAEISKANLDGVDLTRANLSGANLTGSYLIKADLNIANLSGANLTEANFTGADLMGANLMGANLHKTYLRYANISGANLTGTGVTDEQLKTAKGYQDVIMPNRAIHP